MATVETSVQRHVPWRRRRNLWVAGAGLGAVVVVALALTLHLPGSAFTPAKAGFSVNDVQVGDRFTEGFPILRFERLDDDVRLESVEMLGDVDGLRLVDARVGAVGFDGGPVVHDYDPSFPPETSERDDVREWIADFDDLRPVEGAVLRGQKSRHHELVLGIEVTAPGVWERTGLRVNYVQDGVRRRQDIGFELVVCTPEGLVDGSCTDRSGNPLREQ